MPQNYTGRILIIVVVVLAACWAIVPKPQNLFRSDLSFGQKVNLKPGIDMQGGTSLLYEIKAPEGEEGATGQTAYRGGLAEEVMAALKKRIDPQGVKNLIWRPHGDTKLEIQMPATAESQQAERLGLALNAARTALEKTNVSPSEVIAAVEQSQDAAARDKRLAELAGGSKVREEVFRELVSAWERLQQARQDQNVEAAAAAQEAYAKAQARIGGTNLRPGDLEMALELTGAERQQRLDAIRKDAADFPARAEALDKYVASFDAFAKVRDQIDDVADLKRKLRGAGVLEFHILATDAPPSDVMAMQQRLEAEGPRATDGRLKWFEVDRGEAIGGPTATYNGKTYVLAWITPERSLDHRQGSPQWALRGARPTTGQFGEAEVAFSFDPVGGRLFGELTGSNINMPLAVMLDKKVISAPNINSRISDNGVISGGGAGGFSQDELDYLVSTLNAGSLKAQLADEPISERTVGPQLGADNLRRGLLACVFGLVIVAVFLIGYYYLSGVVATVAVLLNMVLLLGAMALSNATFTLPGIAGIVLTIGMAVDANVLIFERLREEQMRGLSIRMALRNAYDRAFSAILDGNVTTGITAAVLFIFGSEEVKGFGLTLMIGIAASMFTALFVTKTIFGILVDRFDIKRLGSLPMTFPKWDRILHPNIDWMRLAPYAYAFSGIFIVLGLTAFGVRLAQGRMLDVEFTKGTSVQFDLTEAAARELDQSEVRELVEGQSRRTPDALPSPQVVASGGGGSSYEVITPNENAGQVRQAVVDALGAHLKVEKPSTFDNVGATLDAAIAAGAVVPIESATQQVAGFVPNDLPRHVGGAAIVLKNLRPSMSAGDVKDRIERQRLQADSQAESGGYRAFDVAEAPARGPGGENTVVVMVSDPGFPHAADPLKLQQWKDNIAGPMWQTVNEGINKAAELQRVSNFDAQVAGETQRDAFIAMFLSVLGIMAYIWVRFGNLKYGTATVVALLHDTLFVLAAVGFAHYLAELGFFRSVLLIEPFRINLTMVAAVLTVMGYSMNDTVVVFDRIRENRGRLGVVSRQVINDSINQTLSRTLLTGGTTILTILVMYIWGGSGIHGFTFALLVGIIVGTYSSIMIAAPILLFGQGRETGGEGRPSQEAKKTDRPTEKLQGVGAS
jgi:SecD/SecF fusion protein